MSGEQFDKIEGFDESDICGSTFEDQRNQTKYEFKSVGVHKCTRVQRPSTNAVQKLLEFDLCFDFDVDTRQCHHLSISF